MKSCLRRERSVESLAGEVRVRRASLFASRPQELLNQDTFYWGSLKGVAKVYVQVVVDVFCSLAFAKLHNSKVPITAADLLYDRVLPFYDALGVPVGAILTDNGREFCGRPETHDYELLVAMEGIEHRTSKVRSPRTNGFVERMNLTLLDECFRVEGRKTWYETTDQIQADLDRFLECYNLRRRHQGYRLQGRTPAAALTEVIGLTLESLPPSPPPRRTGGDHRTATWCLAEDLEADCRKISKREQLEHRRSKRRTDWPTARSPQPGSCLTGRST